jgi:hypothetical protein
MSGTLRRATAARALMTVSIAIVAAAGLMLAGSLMTSPSSAAGPKNKDSRRAYYLSRDAVAGGQALAVCLPGFHMASLYEIFHPSNLRYDTTLGVTLGDAGSGPLRTFGWIRTGSIAQSTTTSVPGNANCNAWQSSSPSINGSLVGLDDWANAARSINPWRGTAASCQSIVSVWCVED